MDRAALSAAAARAAVAPDDLVPCPGCAARVRGSNLGRHLREVHGATAGAGGAAPDEGQVGVDRRIRRWFVAWVVLLLLALGALAPAASDALEGSRGRVPGDLSAGAGGDLLARLAGTPFAWVLVGGAASLVLCVVAHRRGVFRARVTVRADEVVLRHRLGTGTVRVALPAVVETGEAYRRTSTGGSEHPVPVERTEGTYLRVVPPGRRRGITVRCRSDAGLRSSWTGWQQGGRRRQWDLVLEPPAFVALHYALARAGALQPRPRS